MYLSLVWSCSVKFLKYVFNRITDNKILSGVDVKTERKILLIIYEYVEKCVYHIMKVIVIYPVFSLTNTNSFFFFFF